MDELTSFATVNRLNSTLSTRNMSSRRGVTSVAFSSRPTAPSARPVSDLGRGFSLLHCAYRSPTDSPLLSDPELNKVAEKHNVPPATILISYQPARGVVVLPKSVSKDRIEQNLKLIDLDEEDMEVLNDMAAKGKQQRVNTPLFGWDLVSSATFLVSSELALTTSARCRDSTTGTPSKRQRSWLLEATARLGRPVVDSQIEILIRRSPSLCREERACQSVCGPNREVQ